MPGVNAEENGGTEGMMVTNGRNGGDGQQQQQAPRKSKSDDSASFLRAARGGNTEKVLEYLKNGTDINTCNANGLNALHLASKEGHKSIVTELLARGAKIDSATKKGNTALHIASLAGQNEVVKILVTHSASVNVQSQNGFTPLYMAAQENHDEVVRFLLASGASQSLATEDGFTPLAVALQQGHDKVVAVLLENDTRGKVRLPALHIAAKKDDTKAAALLLQNDHNPDVTSKSGFTPLHIAAHYGNESIAVVLLQRGADVNYSAKHNITPLHVAAKWGKGNMVGLLLDKGANLEARTRDGLTPLHCAARSGHENVVDMMLQRGAPISAKTKNGLAPVHMASQGDHVDAARVLLHHKAPVDEVTVDYLTALHVAAHCGHVRVAKLLLDRKADPNSRALNGFTPLHIACKKNRIKVVELLLKYGASKEAKTESGLTPLHVASFMGCMNIVIFLIQHQASPDEATVRGETPLHLAARANQTDIIRILLRNGAKVDARAREQQTPLHIASRLGNVDIVVLLLQQSAQVDAVTKDLYTALHIAAKEGQEEVAGILIEHNAEMSAATKKGFTPLHLAAKYGNMKVAKLLIAKDAPVDAEGKNGVTPLHVAVHYDNQNVAMLLLDKNASPHACAKNGYTPLHISAKKNQLDIAKTLLDYGAKVDAESKAGFSPLHLAGQEGHMEIASLLIKQGAAVNAKAKNGLTPIHLCAQENKVDVAELLVDSGADCDAETKAGYTPLHVASHFGQMAMVRFLLEHGVRVDVQNELGYSPLHQAAQQGHSQIVNLLLEANASPNTTSNTGQTALSIAQKLGYISVVETLKVVTDTVVTTTTTTTVEEKYKVLAPESMQETFMSDSEDEGGEGEEPTNDKSYQYLTTDDVLKMGDDTQMDVTAEEGRKTNSMSRSHHERGPVIDPAADSIEQKILQMEKSRDKPDFGHGSYVEDKFAQSDNVNLSGPPIAAGFLVSFMVDARGGAMRGCRHSGVRVIIPPRKAPMPMRVTCRYLKKDKLIHPPPLMEGEAIASRILELGPAGAKFLGPVIIEVPHFASLRGKEREIVILRSDNGENWKEHTLEATEEAVQEVLQDSFDEGEATQLEDLNTNRITRILTTDFPQYFAIITRIRQEVHAIGPEGGVVNSTVVPQVQAVFPQGALTKKIKVGLQAQPIPTELTAKLLGNRVAVSPIVTVEPRRRKFHKPITLTIPVPVAASKGMINQYSGDTPTLRLLCSITGGTTRAQWEDVTGSTPLTFVNDCVNFTTTVSARFWLMDCRNVGEATKMATSLYKEAIYVPFMAKFCVFSKRHEMLEARMRVFCMTDDKEEKTLEHQEHFHEVAKSRDVEVMEGKTHHLEFYGNLFPVTKSGEQLSHKFHAFRENRLPFTVRVKDPNSEPLGRISFFIEPKRERGEAQQQAICNLNINLPEDISPEAAHHTDQDLLAIQAKYSFLREAGYGKFDTIHRADLRVSDISNLLGSDWIKLARELDVEDQDINLIISEYPDNVGQQAMVMLRLWLNTEGNKATGNALEKALKQCDRQDIVNKCMFNVEQVTDNFEKRVAENELEDQSGFAAFKEDLAPTNNGGVAGTKALLRDYSIHVNVDESEHRESDGSFDLTQERLTGVNEEATVRSESTTNNGSREGVEGLRSVLQDNKQEEATSVYEREEHKYVAEEKEFAASFHKEQMSQNLISQSQTQELSQDANNVVTERSEARQEFLHEDMKKMSLEEKTTMRIADEGGRMAEVTSESRMEEQHQAREEYNNERMETRQTQMEQREDGTTLILTEAKAESKQAFSSQSQDSRRFEHTETTVTGAETSADEAANLKTGANDITSEHGFEEQIPAPEFGDDGLSAGKPGTSDERGSSSYSSDESGSESAPHSPSPKVSPGSKSPSPRISPMKDTDQELLDEMIIKDVPESESSTDPVKKFEDLHPPASIESIQEDQEEASDSECKEQPLSNLALATHPPHQSSHPLPSPSSSERSPEMAHKEEDKSPLIAGLAAPDSKDSLEVQLTSACEDLSESQISGKGSLDEHQQRQESSESEEEHQPTVNERSASEDAGRRPSISDFVLEEESKGRKSISETDEEKGQNSQVKKIELVDTDFTTTSDDDFGAAETIRKINIVDTDLTTSDEEFEIVTKQDMEEAKIVVTKDDTSTDEDKIRPPLDGMLVPGKRLEKLESIPSTDTEPRQSRPSSSDYSDIYRQKETEDEPDSSDDERNTEIIKANEPRIHSASSDYSENEKPTPRKSSISSAFSENEEKRAVTDSSEYEKEKSFVRKSSASSAISDIVGVKPKPTVDSSSEYDHEVIKDEYVRDPVISPARAASASSDFSDQAERKSISTVRKVGSDSSESEDAAKSKRKDTSSSESEEGGEIVRAADPRAPSASSDYSDIAAPGSLAGTQKSSGSVKSLHSMFEGISKSQIKETEVVTKVSQRAYSVSSDSTEIASSSILEANRKSTGSVKSLHEMFEKGSVPVLFEKAEEEKEPEPSEIETRTMSVSSDYSDIVAPRPLIATQKSSGSVKSLHEMFEGISKSSVVSIYSEKEGQSAGAESVNVKDDDEDVVKEAALRTPSVSSDYSDIAVPRPLEAAQKASGSVKSLHEMFEGISKSSVPVYSEKKGEESSLRPISSDYSDVEINQGRPTMRPISSDYSDLDVIRTKPSTHAISSDYSDLEVTKTKPSMRPLSSDYSDLEEISKPRSTKEVESSESEDGGKVTKPAGPRAPSASSDYSDIVAKPSLESSQTASGSVKSLHEMFEGMSKTSVKEKSIVEKKGESSSSSESEEDEEEGAKRTDPRVPSASSDYSDIVEKQPKKTLNHGSSSEYDIEGEKPERGLQETQQKSFSSDYSDIQEKKQEERIEEIHEEDSSDFEKEAEFVKPARRPISSDYSDLEVSKGKPQMRPISSDYSDVEITKTGVSRKQSAPARPSSSDYSDLDVNKDQITRKYSETAGKASSSDYSDVEQKEEAVSVRPPEKDKEELEPGMIQIVVHKAADLVNQEIMGKSDPYVIIKFRGQEFRSHTVRNTINPEWNFSTDLVISEIYDSNINIEVFDDDSGLDSCEGILVLTLHDAIKRSSEEGRWYSLTNCKHGRIFVSCIFTAMPSPSKTSRMEPAQRTRTYSSSSEEEVTKEQNTVLQQSSSDSSDSATGKRTKVQHQMAMDRASMDEDPHRRGSFKPQSSSDYSDTDNERRGVESSSDYDSTPARQRRNRPGSIVSDTSSDAGSNVGARNRPLSQFLDDEYDIITEEEAAETKSEKKEDAESSSSSESHGPENQDAETRAQAIPPVHLSSVEDQEQDGDQNGTSLIPPILTPHPTLSSSVASNSAILSSDQHAEAEQTSVSVEVAKSSVINSNTLDEIGPLAEDMENGSQSQTKQLNEKKNKEGDDPQSSAKFSSSSCSSIDQAQREGSSESERSQEADSSTKIQQQ